MSLDRIDLRILQQLQEDSSLTNQELSEKVGLSPSPCLRRVKALEEQGLIQGYRAHLDAKKLGLDLLAQISISMDKHTPERFDNFEKAIRSEEHTSELQSRPHLVCRLLLEKKKKK